MHQSNNLKMRKTAEMPLTESETYCLEEVRRHDHDRYLTDAVSAATAARRRLGALRIQSGGGAHA